MQCRPEIEKLGVKSSWGAPGRTFYIFPVVRSANKGTVCHLYRLDGRWRGSYLDTAQFHRDCHKSNTFLKTECWHGDVALRCDAFNSWSSVHPMSSCQPHRTKPIISHPFVVCRDKRTVLMAICCSRGMRNATLRAECVRNWYSLEECGFIKASDEAKQKHILLLGEWSSKRPERLWNTVCCPPRVLKIRRKICFKYARNIIFNCNSNKERRTELLR